MEESSDLAAPHQEVGSSEFGNVCHIDIEYGRVFSDGDGFV